jgi:2-polyprenyl-6-methoxyphenol hydroxylase-like FAD-dependent oxidoreductase
MKEVDVLIVGAGPTGLTLANDLARHKIRFEIVEKNSTYSKYSKALVVQARSLEIFDYLSIAQKAISQGQIIKAFNAFAEDKKIARLKVNKIESKYPFPLILEQNKTEKLLYEQLKRKKKNVSWNTELVSMKDQGSYIEAEIKKGKKRSKVKARYIVGCDGAHSTVRHTLGFDFAGFNYEDEFIVADVELDWNESSQEIFLYNAKGGVFGGFPMKKKNNYRLILTRKLQSGEVPTFSEIKQLAAERTGVDFHIKKTNWISKFKVHCRGVSSYSKGRYFLAGDAAHIHSPAGGQGMNTGIQDAFNLGFKLAHVILGNQPEKILNTYNQERKPVGHTLLKTTDRFFRAGISNNPFLRFARRYLAFFFAKLNFVQKIALSVVSQTRINYKKSSLSFEKNLHTKKGIVAGYRIPDLEVSVAKKKLNLYDLLNTPNYLLLLFCRDSAKMANYLEEINGVLTNYKSTFQIAVIIPAGQSQNIEALIENKNKNIILCEDVTTKGFDLFGVTQSRLYLVRPDGHVGMRCDRKIKDNLKTYLSSWFLPK